MSWYAEPTTRAKADPAWDGTLRRAPAPGIPRRGGGDPLPESTRKDFESRFRHDFSGVRVHRDAAAADAMGARAFTAGHDVVFGAGEYAPESRRGRELLAHELAHVVQQPGVVARQGRSPFDDPETRRLTQRARAYEPRLRPHTPSPPRISPPPEPADTAPPVLPATCPPARQVQSELAAAGVIDATIAAMQRQINIATHQTSTQGVTFQPALLRRADQAIRAEFGNRIPRTPSLTDPSSTTVMSPQSFAQSRVPAQADAERRVGVAVMEVAADGESESERLVEQARQGTPITTPLPKVTTSLLHSLCIRDGNDANLRTHVITPLIQRQGMQFVRDWEAARIGGQTTLPQNAPPHVDLPDRSRNLGHIIVHEAMHFYVHNQYHQRASANPRLEDVLMEGGAEYLARHVIHAQLASDPDFRINYLSRADQFRFVSNNVARGGLDIFAQAYFQGRTDLIGLPKRAVTAPGDAVEREADRMAAAALADAP